MIMIIVDLYDWRDVKVEQMTMQHLEKSGTINQRSSSLVGEQVASLLC